MLWKTLQLLLSIHHSEWWMKSICTTGRNERKRQTQTSQQTNANERKQTDRHTRCTAKGANRAYDQYEIWPNHRWCRVLVYYNALCVTFTLGISSVKNTCGDLLEKRKKNTESTRDIERMNKTNRNWTKEQKQKHNNNNCSNNNNNNNKTNIINNKRKKKKNRNRNNSNNIISRRKRTYLKNHSIATKP